MKSFVPDLERDLVLAFMLGKINEQKFLERFQDDPAQRTLTWLEGAFRACDPLATELALSLGHRFGFTPEALPWLHRLAVVDWHTRHEDVVSARALIPFTPRPWPPSHIESTTSFKRSV
jgi:hypothetical protein